MNTVAVLGAGASGYAAAIQAARAGNVRVVLVNASARTARKVLVSGNGRCNMGNTHVDVDCYITQDRRLLQEYLQRSTCVPDFWQSCGVMTRRDAEGRIYPWSNKAQSVADALSLAARNAGVVLVEGNVQTLCRTRGGWLIHTDKENITATAVVVALGNMAAPNLGATDTGLRIAAALGLAVAPSRPMLVPLRTTPHHASLKGCRQQVRLTLSGEHAPRVEEGEVLFTDYGLSGIAAMQLSAYLGGKDIVTIDLLPQCTREEVKQMVYARAHSGAYPTVDMLLTGVLERVVAYAVMKDAGISPLDLPTAKVSAAGLNNLCALLKAWPFRVDGTLDYDAAQVAAGGVLLSALDETLQAKSAPGVFFAGEVLDVTGLCGGYNLHWAWLSGLIAGEGAAIYSGNS